MLQIRRITECYNYIFFIDKTNLFGNSLITYMDHNLSFNEEDYENFIIDITGQMKKNRLKIGLPICGDFWIFLSDLWRFYGAKSKCFMKNRHSYSCPILYYALADFYIAQSKISKIGQKSDCRFVAKFVRFVAFCCRFLN